MTRRRWTALPATVKGLPAVAMTAALLAAFGQGPPVPAQHPLARAVLTAQQGPPPGPQPPPVDTGLAQRIGRFHSLETDLARAEQTVAAAEAALRAAQFPPAGSPATPRGTLAKLAGRLVKAREAQLSVENKLIAAGQTITAEGVKKAGKLRLSQISEVDAVTAGWRSVSTDQQKRSKDWLDATRPLGKPINIDYQSRSKRIPRMHKSLSGAAASGALDRKYDATLTNPGQGVTKALPPPAAAANKALDALMGGGRIITTPITAWSTRITGSVGLQLFKDPTDSAYYLLIRNKRGKVEVEELPNMVRAPLKFAESPFIPVGSIEGVEYGLVIEGVANTQDAFGLKWEKQLDREGWTAIRLFSLRPGPQVIKGGSDKGQVGKLSRQTTVSTKVDFPVKLAIRLPGQQEAWTLPTVVEAKLSLDVGQHFPKDWSDPAAIARLMELKPTFELVAGVDYNFNTFVKMVTEWMEANHIPVHPGLAQAIGGVFGKVNLSFEKALVLPLHKTGFKGISLPIYSPPGPSLPSGPNTTPAQGGQPIGTAAQPKVAGVRRSGSPVAGPALRPKIAPGRYNAATLKLVDRLTQARLRVQLSNVPGRKQAVELRIGRNTAAWPRPPRWTYETWRVYTPLSTSTLPDVVAGVRDAARLAAKAGARGVVVDLHRNSVTAAQLAAELDALHGQQVSTGPVLIAGESATKGGTDIVRVDDTGGPTTPATCNCFPAGTPVATTAGSVPIQNIRVGDRVWAHDLATGRTEVRRVTALFHRQATRMLTLRVSGGITVRVTPDHPFYVPGRGWVTAEALRPGQPLLRRDGATARLLAVSARDVRTTVYNFSVASDHDYYVSPAQLLVHNCTPTPSP